MALSQLQCLDDNHVNPRVHESKPEFLYCEDQRLALEALLHDGREAFFKYLEDRGLRGFLSDPELDTLTGTVEPYDPGSEVFPESAADDESPLSQHYWPELSDTSVPQMDLGWPDSEAYRGVTRATIYSQPPMDGQTHIKEVVRKMIAQAQKVIAVVMDVFTDVDIFRDLLDAGFKRRISVYILLERATLPHFLSMCQRANMHAGHLKHLRVRCTEGVEFYTRSSSRVRGRMGHRFMFIDGDKAVSGSYSFTWISSRLEKSLITVITGQAVNAFDKLFRVLYATSSSVDLQQVAKEPEPEPEPLPQPAAVPPPSAAVARKLYNPKYALALGNPSPSPTPSAGNNSPKNTQSQENSEKAEVPENKKRRRRRASKEAVQEDPPIHPGLTNLEKACLISYLPTWPEPDPPSDVIGFINIRDANKPIQVHLQRSEMYGTSQAIKFSSPFSVPKETLPELDKPRQLTVKPGEMDKPQPAQERTKAKESVVDKTNTTQLSTPPGDIKSKAGAPAQSSPVPGPKLESDKSTAKTFNNEDKLHSNTPTNQDAGHNTTPHLNAHTPLQSSSKASSSNTGRPSHTTQAVTTNNPKPEPLPGSNADKDAGTSSNTKVAVVSRTHGAESNSTQTSHLSGPTDSNAGQHTQTKTMLPHIGSHTQAVHTQPQNSSEITPDIKPPTINNHMSPSSASQSVSSTSLPENNQVLITANMTTSGCAPSSSISPPLNSSSTTLNPPLPSSAPSSSTSTPPIPKPRTIQLVIKDAGSSDSQKLPESSPIRRSETNTRLLGVHNEPAVATVVQTSPEKETVPELQNKSGSKTQKDAENPGNVREALQQKQKGTFQETRNKEVVEEHNYRARMKMDAGTNPEARSDVLITDAPKAESIQEIIPKDAEPKALTSIDCKLTPQKDCVATVQAGTKAPESSLTGCEISEVPNENSNNVTQQKTYRASVYEQTISYYSSTPQDIGVSETVDSLKAPVAATHTSKDSAGDGTHTSAADTHGKQGNLNTAKNNTHSTSQELIPKARGGTHTAEKSSLRLLLSDTHTPDLRQATPERESRSHTALTRTPTPDGVLPRTPTPDSRTHTPDSRSYTPDLRTPSDGYVTPRPDSALSTTSEEYYECSDSPVFDREAHRSHGTTEDHVSFTNTPNAASRAHTNYNAAKLGTTERISSSSETQSLCGPASVSSSSSLLEKKVKMEEEEGTANEENGREVDEKGRKLSVAERRGSEEAKRRPDHFLQGKDLTETVEKNKETQPQAPKRKTALNQSAAETLLDGGVTLGELTNEEAEQKRLSTGDLKPKRVSSEGERPDKEKAADAAALGPSGVERKGRPQSTKETEGQKLLHTPPRPPRGQKQDSGGSSPSRPSRPPRPLSANQSLGARPSVNRQLSQPESRALHSSFQILDNTSSPRRLPSRPPPPVTPGAVGSAAGRKQAEVLHSQQSLLSQQPLAAQARATAGQSPNQRSFPKPHVSFLHTHTNVLFHPHSQNQTVSAQEAHRQEEGKGPFSFTFSRLYSLKGLKDKMNKLPAQSKTGSTSSPGQGRKSTG